MPSSPRLGPWLFVVAWLVPGAAAAQVFSPGKLAGPHAKLDRKCTACHAKRGGATTSDRCLACHTALGARIAARRGYHGRQGVTRCSGCHIEHKGRGHALIRWPGGKAAAFDHGRTGFRLQGRHRQLDCRRCHQPSRQRSADVRRLPASRRKRTFLGLGRTCDSCHTDPHRGAAGKRCQSCHDQQRAGFKPVTIYVGHERRFPLRGSHRKLACARCHKKDGQSWRFAGTSRDCAGCHQTPHRGVMGQAGARKSFACQACHKPEAGAWRQIRFARERHPSSVPLHGGHARVRCTRCHGAKANRRPKGTRCNACHEDVHGAKLGKNCSDCHRSRGWRARRGKMPLGPMTAGQQHSAVLAGVSKAKLARVSFHNKTGFPLTGRHITVACKRCHRRGRRRGQRVRIKYSRRFARCADCHDDEHRGQFKSHITVNTRHTDCEGCHPLGGLKVTSFSVARHDKGRFPLRGAHRAVPCARCHSRQRPKSTRFTYPDRQCRTCHADTRHRGRYRLTRQGRPPDCSTCHDERSFSRVVFDHDKTKLPLRGRHKKLACRACHKPDASGVVAFRSASTACESCHSDPHRGQFALARERGGVRVPPGKKPAAKKPAAKKPAAKKPADGSVCRRCHDEQRGFKGAKGFDHQRDSRFALTGAHRKVSCNRCHHQVTLADGARVRVYRLGATACKSCHRSPHPARAAKRARRRSSGAGAAAAQSARALAVRKTMDDCARCHSPSGWRRLRPGITRVAAAFDHTLVGHRLRGRHRSASCSACHRPGRAVSRRCGNCHADPHRGRLGQRCAECHSPTSWRPSGVLARHRKTRLPLTGWHALADCRSCHPRAREGVYRGVPANCYGCHAKDYRDPATHPDHVKAGHGTRCEQCHRPSGWRPAAFARSTSALLRGRAHPFTLRGKHARAACASCHKNGRTRPSRRCVSCHAADRQRAKSPPHSSPQLARGCDRCHRPSGWRPARPTRHRFPLVGRHRGVPCSGCHTDGTNFRSYSCLACHERRKTSAAHQGRPGFVYASRACRRCHPLGRR